MAGAASAAKPRARASARGTNAALSHRGRRVAGVGAKRGVSLDVDDL
jgi:hypothetical protein